VDRADDYLSTNRECVNRQSGFVPTIQVVVSNPYEGCLLAQGKQVRRMLSVSQIVIAAFFGDVTPTIGLR